MPDFRKLSAVSLLVAALGILVQIAGGTEYPVVPPGLIILLVAAGLVWFVRRRWSPVAAVLAAVFLIFGLISAGQAVRLVEVDTVLDTVGLWIQMAAVVVALVTAIVAMARPDRPTVRA